LPAKHVAESELRREFPDRHAILEVPSHEVDHLADAERLRQRRLLGSAAEPLSRPGVARVAAEELDPPGARSPQPLQQRDERGLPSAVGAEESEDAAGLNVERYVVDRDDVAVAASHPIEACEGGHEVSPNTDFSVSV
jgi:hypothetical protein